MSLYVVRENPGKPAYGCVACDAVFYKGEETAFERHVIRCSDENFEEMRAESLRAKAPGLFDPNVSGDVEFGKWVRRNRKALIEGRLKM